jgi:hypothetical protein
MTVTSCPLVSRIFVLLILGFFISTPSAFGYEKDTHYYLKFYLALKTTCFDWWESWIIASADWSQDLNETTEAEKPILEYLAVGQKDLEHLAREIIPNQVDWHAFVVEGQVGRRDRRQQELLERALAEPDATRQLIFLGQLLHFAEDVFSHAGFEPGVGHGPASIGGKDADALQNKKREMDMVEQTVKFLIEKCKKLGREHEALKEIVRQVKPLIHKLIDQSNPGWKLGTAALIETPARKTIMFRNIRAIGEAIEKHVEEKILATGALVASTKRRGIRG